MSNTSFEKSFQIRSKSLEELSENELFERVVVDYIAEINKQRRSLGNLPLCIDENCSEASSNSFQSIGNIQSMLKTYNVQGTDFSHIFHEHSLTITPSISQNKSIYEGFSQLFSTLDPTSKTKFLDSSFNSIGMSVKRSFGSFKVMAIFFKKIITVNRVEFDLTAGCKITGKMFDSYSSIFVVALKDSKDSAKPSIAGPKRIAVKPDFKEYEVTFARIQLNSRSMSEKIIEVYTMKADPRSICYGTGSDLNSIPTDAVLSHSMKFLGLWESNLMFEARTLSESQLIKEEYESKAGTKIMVQDIGAFKGKGRGRGTVTTTGRNEWNKSGTPWKSSVGGLSSISEAPRDAEMKSDVWKSADKENYFNRENNVTRDVSMGRDGFGSGFSRENPFGSGTNSNPFGSGTNSNPFGGGTNSNPFGSATNSNPFGSVTNSNPFGGGNNANPFASGTGVNHFAGGNGTGNGFSGGFNGNPFGNVGFTNPFAIQSTSTPPNFQISGPNFNQSLQFPPTNQNFNNFSQPNPYASVPQFNSYNPVSSMQCFNTQNSFPSNFSQFPQMQSFQFFQQPGLLNVPKPNYLLPTDHTVSNFHGINSLPFAIKSPPETAVKSSFYPLTNSEPKNLTKKIRGEGTQTGTGPEDFVLPGLTLPIPPKIIEELRRLKPDNESYAKLFETMEYSDIYLRVKDADLRAHKAVLYSASSFFREQLDKSRTISTIQSPKIVLPSWFAVEGFKLVLKFMYTSSLYKETISIKLAQDMLAIADYLQMGKLCDVLIVQFILTQITKEEALPILKLAASRDKEATEGWEYLVDSCLLFIGQNSNSIVRNSRAECLALPMQCILRIVDVSMRFLSTLEHASLVIKLLTDCHYAQCIFELTQKVTNLFLFGYNTHCVDIQRLDYIRPLTKDQNQKLSSKTTMEYPLLEEKAPWFLTTSRSSQVPAKKLPDSVNQIYSYGKPLSILPKKELNARNKHSFSFTVTELFRPKNVMSKCFTTDSRVWSVLIQTSLDGHVSVFLCERGPVDNTEKFISLLYTSVLFEIEIEDEGVKEVFRSKNQPECFAGFYSFPSDQFHIAGERNFCKASSIRSTDSVKVSVHVREVGIHSGLLHYLCENFETLAASKSEKFVELDHFNMKYLLSHDALPVENEREAVAALWKYSMSKSLESVNLLVSEIRFGFLANKDLFVIARDHKLIRNSSVFKFLFEEELRRRVGNKKNTQRARRKYRNVVEVEPEDNVVDIVNWFVTDNHHAGHEGRIEELKKKIEEQKKEMMKLKNEVKKPEPSFYRPQTSELPFIPRFESPPRLPETEVFYTPDKNCKLF